MELDITILTRHYNSDTERAVVVREYLKQMRDKEAYDGVKDGVKTDKPIIFFD